MSTPHDWHVVGNDPKTIQGSSYLRECPRCGCTQDNGPVKRPDGMRGSGDCDLEVIRQIMMC